MGLMLRFIGPLTIVPTITLVGLPLFETAYQYSSKSTGNNFIADVEYNVIKVTLLGIVLFGFHTIAVKAWQS